MKADLKTKLVVLAIIVVVITIAFSSVSCIRIVGLQGSGNVVSEEREVSGFNAIALSAGMNLYLEQGDKEYCKIEAEDNVITQIITEVKNGKLIIRYKNMLGGITNIKPVNFHITFKNLNEISASSGSRVESSLINTDSLKVNISSGATGTFEVNARTLDVGLSSGSQMEISGETGDQKVNLSSGVTYDAEDLKSKNAEISVSSGAQAKIAVSDNLNVNISSGGSVYYSGKPQVTSNISSGGLLKSN